MSLFNKQWNPRLFRWERLTGWVVRFSVGDGVQYPTRVVPQESSTNNYQSMNFNSPTHNHTDPENPRYTAHHAGNSARAVEPQTCSKSKPLQCGVLGAIVLMFEGRVSRRSISFPVKTDTDQCRETLLRTEVWIWRIVCLSSVPFQTFTEELNLLWRGVLPIWLCLSFTFVLVDVCGLCVHLCC